MSVQDQPSSDERENVGSASLMLVLTTLLWGMSFPWTYRWQQAAKGGPCNELLAGLTLIAVRMPLALVLLGLARPQLILAPSRREHIGGVLLGSVFFVGFALQTWGLAWTTPALSGFFTCLCCVWMPLFAWLLLGQRLVPVTLAGLGVGLLGCLVLVEGGLHLGKGEWLTLYASVAFAGQMLLLNWLAEDLAPAHLSSGFLAASGLLAALGAVLVAVCGPGLSTWAAWTVAMLSHWDTLQSVVFLAVFPTMLAFHWMNVYQPLVPPGRAALIYLLEPVFSSIFSVWWGYDEPRVPLVLGGALILVGNLLVEMPRWLPFRKAAR
jgi:drug/metabolite transporter (DMT)-like permease